mgnify:CR=1 FL=1
MNRETEKASNEFECWSSKIFGEFGNGTWKTLDEKDSIDQFLKD